MTGELRGIQISYPAHRAVITLEVDAQPEEVEQYREQNLDIKIAVHREKRTLTANSYYWELVGKLGSVMRLSKTEIHNWLLSEYGQISINAEGVADWAIKSPRFDWMKSAQEHYRPAHRAVSIHGKQYPVYWIIKGSHLYNRAEMSELIDGTVRECREQGIETRPDEEVQQLWQV